MKLRPCLVALAVATAACLAPSMARQKDDKAEKKVKVEVHLAAEHAPDGLKAGSRAKLTMVVSSVKTKKGKAMYSTRPLADDVEVVAVKREKKPADPDKAVQVELQVTKAQKQKIDKVKAQMVTVIETVGGKAVAKMRPVPLRLELVKPAKE